MQGHQDRQVHNEVENYFIQYVCCSTLHSKLQMAVPNTRHTFGVLMDFFPELDWQQLMLVTKMQNRLAKLIHYQSHTYIFLDVVRYG